jgi:hypothetical protein
MEGCIFDIEATFDMEGFDIEETFDIWPDEVVGWRLACRPLKLGCSAGLGAPTVA